MRTCIGCRVAQPASDLVRVTVGPGDTLVAGGPSVGRGVWVGPSPDCLGAAAAKVRRGLRIDVDRDAFAALVTSWNATLVARGREATPPPGCPRLTGAARRGQ